MGGPLLAIETSCDDSSAALLDADLHLRSCLVASQTEEHAPFRGVVPEIAGRSHLRNLPRVVEAALQQAGVGLQDLEAIAVTHGPGLIGSLLVGLHFAKGLALSCGKPLLGVNHIRAHVAAVQLEHRPPEGDALALVVSGGHSHLFRLAGERLTLLAKTVDDAAGEAFDKLAKMLGLGFPGGPAVDALAQGGDPRRFPFQPSRFGDGYCHFSFSGLKSQAMRLLEAQPEAFLHQQARADLCASFQKAVVDQLLDRIDRALRLKRYSCLLLGGGVACNSLLRSRFQQLAADRGVASLISAPRFCTDNAAMVGVEGWRLLRQGRLAGLDLAAEPGAAAWDDLCLLRLEETGNKRS